MSLFLCLAFLFFIGSVSGWCVELFYRRYFSKANPRHKWINPGFCTGPYLPLYGSGLCILFLLGAAGDALGLNTWYEKILVVLIMAVCMTAIEYIAGILSLKAGHVRLWDYTNQWGNIQGIICPRFSLYWGLMGAGYYFFVHSHVLDSLRWLSENLAFSFVIGFFYGVFTIDVANSFRLVAKIRAFAGEHQVVVHYERLKAAVKAQREEAREKARFFFALHTGTGLAQFLEEAQDRLEDALEHLHKNRE